MVVSQGDKILVGLHVTEYWMLIGRGRGVGYNRETKYCRSKNVRVSSCRFLKSKLFGTKSARLSVSVEDAEAANILDEEFWPDNITARP